MTQFPLNDLLVGARSLTVKMNGQKSDGTIPVDIKGATLQTGDIFLEDVKASTASVTLQDAVTTPGSGAAFAVGSFKTLTLEVYGTSSAREIKFYGVSASGTKRPIQGVNLLDLSFATGTTGTGEFWSLEVTGLETVYAEVVSVTGGNVTVKGKAVA